MKTSKEFAKNLESGIITMQMLEDCLYSCNKRAKNYRDKEREYRNCYYDKYNNEEKYRAKKNELYGYKDKLLSIINPTCIHKEVYQYTHTRRIFEYEYEAYERAEKVCFNENCYYDRDMQEEVWFRDIKETIECESYYLFYQFDNYSFHIPIELEDVGKYSDLKITEIDCLITSGREIEVLTSLQFVKKVITLIESGKYVLV